MNGDVRLGDIVLYQPHGDGLLRPAIVTHIWSESCVNLYVFADGSYQDEGIHPQQTSVARGPGKREWRARD